eukprot:COSAG06_NODE_52213_length_307_cov_0.725962_1_plen_84_part_01
MIAASDGDLGTLAQKLADAEAQLADKTARQETLKNASAALQELRDDELQHEAKCNEVEAALDALGSSGNNTGKVIADTEAVLRN